MLKAISVRVLLAVMTVAVGVFLAAALVRYAPGFGMDERQLDARLNSDSLRAIRMESNDERQVSAYYFRSAKRMLSGDLGVSRSLHRPIRDLLGERGPITLWLIGRGLAMSWGLAILLTVATWIVDFGWADRLGILVSGSLLCIPAAGVALLLVLFNWPTWLALTLIVFPKTYQLLSALVGAASTRPHILAARARGAGRARILGWHVAAVVKREMLALVGVSVGIAIGASIPVEALSGTPGIGQLAWQAAMARDLPVLAAVSLVVIACTVLANAGSDLIAEGHREGA